MSMRCAPWVVVSVLSACEAPKAPYAAQCQLVTGGPGEDGAAAISADVVADGLEVPWAIAFVPDSNDALVTERPGRIRLIRDGGLVATPVATLQVANRDEAGLLGLALSPTFSADHSFFVYYALDKPAGRVNRVERYLLSDDHTSATADRVILDDIPAGRYHDGGRIRFGPDGFLYVGTGDGRQPERAADPMSPAGKLLRITADGDVPTDNPIARSPAYLTGIRNTQGFDWFDDGAIAITDHGPTGDLQRAGHDEVNVARAGDSLGWPDVWGCEQRDNVVAPLLVFENAVPPGGSIFYRAAAIPEWQGAYLIAALAARHLQVLRFNADHTRVDSHEVYLRDAHGRLREVVEAPDGSLWITTSNCDSRGVCPAERDKVLRLHK